MDVYERNSSNTINITNDSSNARKTCPPPGNDANVLVSILGCLSLPVSRVIEVGDSFSKFCILLSKSNILDSTEPHALLTPVVGAYSSASKSYSILVGRSGAPGIGPTSGAP